MGGNFPTREMERIRKIEEWISNVLRTGGMDRYDELHIDRIDSAWRCPGTWIGASLEALEIAASIRDRAGHDFSVVLGLSLNSTTPNQEVNFSTTRQLTERFGNTPP